VERVWDFLSRTNSDVDVESKGKVVPVLKHHDRTMHGKMEIQFHTFLT
jgi:hypothetical protein